MSVVLLVADCPQGIQHVDNLKRLAQKLGKLPDGVEQLADNVWTVEVEKALNFLFVFAKTAEEVGQKFQASNIPPKPRVGP
jgi:X-X-X-Leu-X-X-Gly heptad repeat protein